MREQTSQKKPQSLATKPLIGVMVRLFVGLLLPLVAFAIWSAASTDWHLEKAPPSFVEKAQPLHGLSDKSIFSRLGKPDHSDEFTMSEVVGEFRIELSNTYPPSTPASANVVIRECTWRYADYSLTVWFHKVGNQWVSLDTLKYSRGVRF